MQVVEKSAEGLSRVIAVTIPASELNAKLDAKAAEVAPQMKLKGFRPGKVPVSHVRKTYGRDLMGEIVNDALNESSQKALDEAKLRPAAPAEMKLVSDMDKVVAGKEDLSYEMALEVMPDFKPVDPKSLKLTRPVYEASDADLDEALKELAGQAKSYVDKGGKAPKDSEIDDDFAKRLGLESIDKLKELLRDNLNQQYKGAARFKLKRALLDQLDEKHSFDLPPKMVDAEFDGIWQQVEADKEAGRLPEADAKKSDKKLKDEYRKIAERRVRLGLVLAEIGRENNVTVTDQELNNAIIAEARNYPGQEQAVLNFYRQNPNAAANMRAPIYEEKVCDLIFDQAEVKEEPISKEDLLKDDEE